MTPCTLRGMLLAALLTSAARHAFSGPDDPEDAPPSPTVVEEVGGRLVVRQATVVVTADPDRPPQVSSIATKTATPLLETPRSVTIVDRQGLDDLQATNISQAHDYAVGFRPVDERGPAFSRGFRVGFYDLRRDGLRTYTWSAREPAGLDRVQYLRGPAALLYGDGSPGGLVNLVLKQPLPVPRYETSLAIGELGFRRATADFTGPLVESRALRYRLVAAGEKLANGFDNQESRVSVLPMLAVDLGPRAVLHLDGEYYDQRGRGYAHFVPTRTDLASFPWDLNVASPEDGWRGWNLAGGLRLDVRLSTNAELHVAGRYTHISGDLDLHGPLGLDSQAGLLRRYRYREVSRWNEYQSDSFAVFAFGGGWVRHRLVAGFEAGLSQYRSEIGAGGASPVALVNPVYPPQEPAPKTRPAGSEITRMGGYLQDQVKLGDRFTLVPGLRISRVRVFDRGPLGVPGTHDGVVDPALGAVFLARRWLSVYASWSQGFEPPTAGQRGVDGRSLEPSKSHSLEGGVKALLLSDRLGVSAAGFSLRQTQVPEADSLGVYRQIGEGRSRGLELEASGSPLPGLTLRAGYAFTKAEISQDTLGFEGNVLPDAAEHQASLWAHYRVAGGALKRLALGAGIVHVGRRFADRANAVPLPAYTRLDATLAWPWREGRVGLALAGQNLLNARYVTSGSGSMLWAGPPRRVALTLTTAF